MSDAAAGVFISYRRQEANWLAAWLHDRLAAHFGEAQIFLDIDWIKPGVDFMQVITEAIAGSRVLLVIIGPQWLAVEGDGSRRLDRPDDPVRVELETAFRRDLRVIPLLLEGATMPRAGDLPDALAALARLNALRVGYQSSRSDVVRLIETLAEDLGLAPSPGSVTADVAVGPGPELRSTRSADRAGPGDVRRDAEQRARLLSRLSRTYTEYLTQSVEHDALLKLQLGLDWLPAKTVRPQDRLLPVPHRQAQRLPVGTTLLQAFDRTGGLDGDGLLVLGEPGAGKTTLLFELAHRLTERAHTDPRHPIPVYLPLSSWATRRPRLDQWLVEQLGELYQIPRPLARRWTNDAQLLFVLDGLDEIPNRDDRTACVKAINQFTRFGRSYRLPVVVASRPAEYDTLPVQLQLETAIGVRPLDPSVVLDALQHAPEMRAAVAVVRRDPELLELLRSPLLVSILTLTYARAPEAQIHATTGSSPAERRRQLITDYIRRRFELDRLTGDSHRKQRNAYPPEWTRAWLSALAVNLTRHQQTVFLLGRLPPDWLPTRWAQLVVTATPGLIVGPIIGLFFMILSAGQLGFLSIDELIGGWSGALSAGLLVGLGAVLGTWLIDEPQSKRRLSWSWMQARRNLRTTLIVGLITGLLFGLASGLNLHGVAWFLVGEGVPHLWALGGGGEIWLITGLISGLGGGLGGGLAVGLVSGLSGLRAGLVVSLIVGLGVLLGVGLGVGLSLLVLVGRVFVLSLGLEGMSEGLSEGLAAGLEIGPLIGSLVGLFVGLGAGLAAQPQPTEHLSWSRAQARSRLKSDLITGLLFGLSAALVGQLIFGSLGALTVGPLVGLGAGLCAYLVGGLSRGLIPLYVTPNEGIRRTVRNGLMVALIVGSLAGLAVGLVSGLFVGLAVELGSGLEAILKAGLDVGLLVGLLVGPITGLIAGLTYGLGTATQYGALRLLLAKYRIAPLRYVDWLNYAVRLRLLYRGASGGYVFIHRIVQDYFCDAAQDWSNQTLTKT